MSASFNKVILLGHLTRDPETRPAGGSQSVVVFGLALNRTYISNRGEQRDETTFVDVEAWGRTGEVVAQYCRKGSPLFVEGRLRFDQWQDRETGQRRNRLSVTAESVQLMGAPMNRDGGDPGADPMSGGRSYAPAAGSSPYGAAAPMPAFRPIADDTPESPF